MFFPNFKFSNPIADAFKKSAPAGAKKSRIISEVAYGTSFLSNFTHDVCLIVANPVRQKIVYYHHYDTDYGIYGINEETINVSNADKLEVSGGFDISKPDFISSCTSTGLSGIQYRLESPLTDYPFSKKISFLAAWEGIRFLYSKTPPPKLVTNQIEPVTVPAGTFSSRHLKFQVEETIKGIPVNRVYQMWLSGIGMNERIIKISEHVELLDGKLISDNCANCSGHTELVFCGWQQASDL